MSLENKIDEFIEHADACIGSMEQAKMFVSRIRVKLFVFPDGEEIKFTAAQKQKLKQRAVILINKADLELNLIKALIGIT